MITALSCAFRYIIEWFFFYISIHQDRFQSKPISMTSFTVTNILHHSYVSRIVANQWSQAYYKVSLWTSSPFYFCNSIFESTQQWKPDFVDYLQMIIIYSRTIFKKIIIKTINCIKCQSTNNMEEDRHHHDNDCVR